MGTEGPSSVALLSWLSVSLAAKDLCGGGHA